MNTFKKKCYFEMNEPITLDNVVKVEFFSNISWIPYCAIS